MSQVHKEALAAVENALPNRSGLDIEIFGMEGIPEDVVQAHHQRVLTQFHQAEAERRAATGNPAPGGGTAAGSAAKKPKFESPSDLKKRLAEHKAKVAAEQTAGGASSGDNTPLGAGQNSALGQSPGAYVSYLCLPKVLFTDTFRLDLRLILPTNNLTTVPRGTRPFPTHSPMASPEPPTNSLQPGILICIPTSPRHLSNSTRQAGHRSKQTHNSDLQVCNQPLRISRVVL
jgi:hypothetical protein